ncbi:hypothetical protein OH77DRAFT_1426043 [Trametes cingulata]|nr:hypothetical protein OH77DRAFT_1426043 [Trametes cingulata]
MATQMLDESTPPISESEPPVLQEGTDSSEGVCHIHKLPAELLTSIFQTLLSPSKPFFPDAGIDDDFILPSELMVANSVCRSWRECLLNTSWFWRKVIVVNHVEWLETCLKRSGQHPVDLAFYRAPKFVESSCLLFDNVKRIHTLGLDETDDVALDLLDTLLKAPMSALEDLRVRAYESSSRRQCFGDEELYALPAIRRVYLEYASVDWRSAAVQRLRKITVRDWESYNQHLTTMDFLRCLDGCRNLEELTLDVALPVSRCVQELDDSEEPPPVARLPNLRQLTLLCQASGLEPDVYHLLSHMRLPLRCDIHLYVQVDDEDDELPDDFLDHIPCDTSCLPILGAATSAEVMSMAFSCTVDGGGSLWFNADHTWFGPERERPPHAPGEQYLDGFCTLFARAPLAHLTVDGCDWPVSAWLELFRTFPQLSRLTIEGSPRQVATALSALRDEDVVLPNLRILDVRKSRWEPELLDLIALCLQFRAAHGTKALARLEVDMVGRNQEDHDVQLMHEKSLQLLRSLVTETVVYKDTNGDGR